MEVKREKEIFKRIRIDLIDRPDEIVRMEIDQGELQGLIQSIKERGLLQPIGVAPRGERYTLIFGDRRYLAHESLDLKYIMCRIQDVKDEQIVIDRAMENIQRVDLTPFEEGHTYIRLIEKAKMSVEEISKRVGKSTGVVKRRIDIMRMPESFQKAIHEGKVSLTVAEEFWSCPDAAKREYFIELAIDHGVTMVVARQWVDDYKKTLRSVKAGDDPSRGGLSPYEDVPIYRACDTCRDPVEYKDLRELRICQGCHQLIIDATQKE